ncbi:MAG: transposase family protein, partial [Planctomycetota bacterium]
MTASTRDELIEVLRIRYLQAQRKEKTRILDEFVAVSGYHRKHAIRKINGEKMGGGPNPRVGRRVYDEAVREALIVLWETMDRICGKRLKAAMPFLLESMERHGHLKVDEELRRRLLKISAATIDRLLAPAREKSKKKRRRGVANTKAGRCIPIRTSADWNEPEPGYFECDFVAHCGGSMAGSFVHSFVVTDIASGWTDSVPLVIREQSVIAEALDVLRARLPVEMRGFDTDNDSAFINETVLGYCKSNGIEFTRSRPRRSNDQAWIEQKNGSVVRRLVGYGRLEGLIAAHRLARLYNVAIPHVNFFQPSFKLREKARMGSKVKKRYFKPATPCDRLLLSNHVSAEAKQRLRAQRAELDPLLLLRTMRDVQEELAGTVVLASGANTANRADSLEQFLARLPEQWRSGEVRPTHQSKPKPTRTWRTRSDPFASVWHEVLGRLEAEPDATAKSLFERLQSEHPGTFLPGQLRTLQRKVRQWRHEVARELLWLEGKADSESGSTASLSGIMEGS